MLILLATCANPRSFSASRAARSSACFRPCALCLDTSSCVGGSRSFWRSTLRASSKLVIACLIPSAPSMRVPAGRRPPEAVLSSVTRSDSSRNTWKTRERRPMARILFLIARRLNSIESGSMEPVMGGETGAEETEDGVVSESSSSEQVLRMASSISVTIFTLVNNK